MRGSWVVVTILTLLGAGWAETCVECHQRETPNVVTDWKLSEHAKQEVGCEVCHGADHQSAADVQRVQLPSPDTCQPCHEPQVTQYDSGKHSLAWAAMSAMPTIHWQPMAMVNGQKGCGGCHKLGRKSEDELAELKAAGAGFGVASCDACHTRHTFSKKEAQQPQACQTCHTGFDHAQWEMYSGSKHGVRYLLKQNGTLPAETVAPTCQTCHMPAGNHGVKTAWGFLAVRLPMPADKAWATARATILQALGVLDPKGQPTKRLEAVQAAQIARLTQEEWQAERDKMTAVCGSCHSDNFAKAELAKGDQMIREADLVMADAIRTVAGLYQDGTLAKPKTYAYAMPDLLTFHDAPTVIEQKLFVMFLEHRMRAFQGTFHANPDYALWYGWSELRRSLTEIKHLAADLRARKAKR